MSEKITKIKKCLDHVLKKQNVTDYSVEIEGQTGKGDGFSGDIIFVKVNSNNIQQPLHLAVKCAMEVSLEQKEKNGLLNGYLKEIHIYDNVKTVYEDLLTISEYSANCLNFMPFCYGTHMKNNNEFLVFENLKHQGFQLWNKDRPMPDEHVELVLQAYGRWHALSVALKKLKPKVYAEITKNNINPLSIFLQKCKFDTIVIKEFQNALKSVNLKDPKILKLLQFSEDEFQFAFSGMFLEDPDFSVILHGDCWNNNFMFKRSEDKSLEVRILDWQCSGMASPIFDLSYFIYACADTEKQDVKQLLKIYYKSFAELLQRLGCQSEKFPFDKVIEHWRKFSRFGLFLSTFVIRMCTNKETPTIKETMDSGLEMKDNFTFAPSTDEDFLKRCENNFLHYCENVQ